MCDYRTPSEIVWDLDWIHLKINLLTGPATKMFKKNAAQKFLGHLIKNSLKTVDKLSPPNNPPIIVITRDISVTIKKQLNKIYAFFPSVSETNFSNKKWFIFPITKFSKINAIIKVTGNAIRVVFIEFKFKATKMYRNI